MEWILRRIRGIIGTGLTWALGWGGINAIMGALTGVSPGLVGLYALGGGIAGFIAGSSFAVVLTLVEGKKTLETLSLKRVAVWGGVGGMVLAAIPLLFGAPLVVMIRAFVVNGLIGAGFATGSVALAKRADKDALLEDGDVSDLLIEGD